MIDFNLPNPYSTDTKFFFLYSGGHGSFIASLLLKYWNIPTKYYFTDTFYEHPTLYKFLNQSLAILHDIEPLSNWCTEVPRLALWKERREYLTTEMNKLQEYYPNFIYDHAGISLWELFEKKRYLANTRVDTCSASLKRKVKDKYLSNNISADTYIGVGIGLWEKHRLDKLNGNSIKYRYHNPFVDCDAFENTYLEQVYTVYPQLEKPYLYTINAPHNNCSGFCVKAGLLQYKNLLEKNRDLYLEHEENEQELYRRVPTVKPFLRKKKNTQIYYITLQQYRIMLENNLDIGEFEDWGSCSCFL